MTCPDVIGDQCGGDLSMRLHLRRRTATRRLTALYGGLFLLSGLALLGLTNGLSVRSTSHVSVGPSPGPAGPALAQARASIRSLQGQLDAAQSEAARRLLVVSAIALGVMLLASLLLGRVAAGRVLRPLRQMTATTRRISEHSLHQRLAVTGPADEVKDLADTIDGLLERLELAFAAQRGFVANASHELRTPLTTMRAALDVAVAKPGPVPAQTTALAGRLRAELDQVDRLLEGLLVLARAQHGPLPDSERLSLGGLAARALARQAGPIAARNLTVQLDGGHSAWADGSPALLGRMIDNIIDNAIVHNADGGWITVRAGAGDGLARLVVETGGRVLDQDQVDELGQPFRRLGADRTGSDTGAGLGLSIVAAIAAAHGGTLELRARAAGGLAVSIGLPAAPQPVLAGSGA
jgi:signal transduction histidine kinase